MKVKTLTLINCRLFITTCLVIGLTAIFGCAFGQDSGTAIDTGDTAWMMISTALVMLMTPALALFYGGMVRGKNVLSSIMHSFIALGVVTLQWVVIGYSLSFSEGNSFIGGFKYAFFNNMEPASSLAPTIPHQVFAMYQMMFAVITPALISGAIAERMKFSSYIIFILLWSTLVYNPLAHWVWGGGWLQQLGALDFAGGAVVHISSGFAGLAAALVLGPRSGFRRETMLPNNLTMTVLGAGMLWFGWFGFNAGSALGSGALAASAFTATHIASAAAMISWAIIERIHHGKVTMLGAASGCVAGLVAVTPAAGFVTPVSGLIIGLIAGVVCYIGVNLKSLFGYDDALDAFGVHGIGGLMGALLTGIFASSMINPLVSDVSQNWIAGNLFLTQLLTAVACASYSFILTCAILMLLKVSLGLRTPKEQESTGLDLALHGETGYNL